MTTSEYIAAKQELAALRAELNLYIEERNAAEYTRRAKADREAGRDTSGKSVARRQLAAHDTIMMNPDEATLLMREEIAELERQTQAFGGAV